MINMLPWEEIKQILSIGTVLRLQTGYALDIVPVYVVVGCHYTVTLLRRLDEFEPRIHRVDPYMIIANMDKTSGYRWEKVT